MPKKIKLEFYSRCRFSQLMGSFISQLMGSFNSIYKPSKNGRLSYSEKDIPSWGNSSTNNYPSGNYPSGDKSPNNSPSNSPNFTDSEIFDQSHEKMENLTGRDEIDQSHEKSEKRNGTYENDKSNRKSHKPDGTEAYDHLWVQCEDCYHLNFKSFLKERMYFCEECGFHLRMGSSARIELLIDRGTWVPMNENMTSVDIIDWDDFPDFSLEKLKINSEFLEPTSYDSSYDSSYDKSDPSFDPLSDPSSDSESDDGSDNSSYDESDDESDDSSYDSSYHSSYHSPYHSPYHSSYEEFYKESDDGFDDESDDGSDNGSNDGSDNGSNDGSDNGSNDGSDNGSNDGSDNGSNDGSDLRSDLAFKIDQLVAYFDHFYADLNSKLNSKLKELRSDSEVDSESELNSDSKVDQFGSELKLELKKTPQDLRMDAWASKAWELKYELDKAQVDPNSELAEELRAKLKEIIISQIKEIKFCLYHCLPSDSEFYTDPEFYEKCRSLYFYGLDSELPSDSDSEPDWELPSDSDSESDWEFPSDFDSEPDWEFPSDSESKLPSESDLELKFSEFRLKLKLLYAKLRPKADKFYFELRSKSNSELENFYLQLTWKILKVYYKLDMFRLDLEKAMGWKEESYTDKLDTNQRETGLTEAVQTGIGYLNGIRVAMGVMDFEFMGGSMGAVVGEKITRLIEYATHERIPLILVCASGGARMQEGSLSLMQMGKIASILYNYQLNEKLFYISILTSPTTGGVTASFGMLGNVVIGEPDSYIAFAGKRVIEETLKIEVPEGVQETDNLFDKGLFDLVVPRNYLKCVLGELFQLHAYVDPNSIDH
uniref:acetyl-CoA carboxylase carboxyltransferase beta subunit n=1 Tax=Ceratostigma griffithii TaxID=1699511 RepID=UPI00233E716E|nr:acetyl-CoA carboxylase carboxyltransferase beta subunit [Ceratostigma griffithii]WBR75738.1 acetyl-CoA carboxylase carboxyltransferase beta subunit [Ceratostigma griffithii]